jgi:Peptidase family S41
MRYHLIFIGSLFVAMTSFSQTLPITETEFTIHKEEKQSFEFSLQNGYTIKARLEQKGVDISISLYKKGDTTRLAYFDSPNGAEGPELVQYEATAEGDYVMVVVMLDENTVPEGNYSIRQLFKRVMMANRDTEFAKGSRIKLDKLSIIQIENLSNLGKVWGFLKYYHPAVAQGIYNWDASLFRVMPRIISAPTKIEANKALEDWVDSIGKPDSCASCTSVKLDSAVHQLPDYGDLFSTKNLGSSLVKKLIEIKDNRNQEDNYYVGTVSGVGNPDFSRENPYEQMSNPDVGYRLLSLYRYWNIIQYFFPYKYVIGEDWNKILPEFIPKFVSAKDATEFSLVCLEIIARIHDTHANLQAKGKELINYFGKNGAPVQARFIEKRLVVTGYYTDANDIQTKLKIGDVITMIDGRSIDRLLKEKSYLVTGSNEDAVLRSMPFRLLRSNSDLMELTFLHTGKTTTEIVHCISYEKINFNLDASLNSSDSSYKIIQGNIGYLFPGRYHNRQLPAIRELFKNTKGIIIDMRTYPSEFMPFTFGVYLKPASSPFAKFTNIDVTYPGVFRFTPPVENGFQNSTYYKGMIIELVNNTTQSQAEYTTMAFQTAPSITVIGSTTAGADGNVSLINLPGGRSTYISGLGVFYPDGTETQRKGIKIDLIVKPTIEGIKNGKDELLEKAIELINSKTDH